MRPISTGAPETGEMPGHRKRLADSFHREIGRLCCLYAGVEILLGRAYSALPGTSESEGDAGTGGLLFSHRIEECRRPLASLADSLG